MNNNTLLVTAFEPFGPIRGHVPGLKGNRSQGILSLLQQRHQGEPDLDFRVFPVSEDAGVQLQAILSGDNQPGGILLMGENLLANLRLEVLAIDPEHQLGPLRLAGAERINSSFAQSLESELSVVGVSVKSGIGTYFCNRLYWIALQWAARTGRPAVFLHVGPLASIEAQCSKVDYVLYRLQKAIRS
jgi:pyrrolidone-carboxylate peptidase